MKIIDNITSRLVDDLKGNFKKNGKVSIAASAFSIYAFAALRKELDGIDELRFVFTSPTFLQEHFKREVPKFYIPHLFKESELCGGEFELRLRNQLTQRAIAKECSRWVREKVSFKSNKNLDAPISGMVHVHNSDDSDFAWTNVNSFTTNDLGLTQKKGFPTLIQRMDFPNSKAYLDYFNQIWENQDALQEVTEKVQQYFEKAFQENTPEFIYFITLYNIFNDFLDDLNLDHLPDERIGFKETHIWNKLYNFQKDAVVGAINKLEKYNGCILADSVGLGKTFSALGVIKYYEMRNKDVLVLCPKKLEANWITFRNNDKNNSLYEDKFHYDVLFHTDLSRDHGYSNGRNLANVNWGNYGLVVIDESHNFRNAGLTYSGKENRYQRLLRQVIKEGIETKLLMLSATPVNNRFSDLKNQLALAYEGDPEVINNKLDIKTGIDQIFRQAQSAFKRWSKIKISERTTENLLEMLDFDFFEILDSLTIARSRKHIITYYDTSEIGDFPKRNKPISIQSPLTGDFSVTYEEIASLLNSLSLCVYSPLEYVLPSQIDKYAKLYDKQVKSGKLTQKDRERSLRILMGINLLKRLESSVDSFRITTKAISYLTSKTLKSVQDKKVEHLNGLNIEKNEETLEWEPDWGDEEEVVGKTVKVHLADIDRVRWAEDLNEDAALFERLLVLVKDITSQKDRKLQILKERVAHKLTHPFNPGNKKIIVFTAFADTAEYLYRNISSFVKDEFKLNTALITGSKRINTSSDIPNDFNTLLSCFSPLSKEKKLTYPEVSNELDILIATDCISEGQNLQDCDFLINYDIHWNPVRIIQRFGRIDRIGSHNDTITLVNFWPDISLDAYINLKQRVENRMTITDLTSTADDNLLKENETDSVNYRKLQLKKLQEEVIDLEDFREGVDITDLGLNDFRIDLTNFIHEYGDLKNIPEGLHAVVSANNLLPEGVIFVLKNVNETININKVNRLHPFYLVYVHSDGSVFFNHGESKKILDAMRMLCKGETVPLMKLCDKINDETDEYHDMTRYSQLLKKSIESIMETEEEKEVMSLFSAGGTITAKDRFRGIEDFKLVSFIIIKTPL